jgi:hypothetical protein
MHGRSIVQRFAITAAIACFSSVAGCGTEGSRCNSDEGCDDGLTCINGACVPVGGGGGTAGDGGTSGTGGAAGTSGAGGSNPGTCNPDLVDPTLCGSDCQCDPATPSICGTICIDPICGGFENFDTARCGDDGRCVCICVENLCTDAS